MLPLFGRAVGSAVQSSGRRRAAVGSALMAVPSFSVCVPRLSRGARAKGSRLPASRSPPGRGSAPRPLCIRWWQFVRRREVQAGAEPRRARYVPPARARRRGTVAERRGGPRPERLRGDLRSRGVGSETIQASSYYGIDGNLPHPSPCLSERGYLDTAPHIYFSANCHRFPRSLGT